MRVLVYGAGSAGMHHAHAASELGWDVDVVDPDQCALYRLPEVYVRRYGDWDANIVMHQAATSGQKFDLAVIATPPETHLQLALRVLNSGEAPRILIEKPLCTAEQLSTAKTLLDHQAFVGYGHTLQAHVPWGKDMKKLYVRWTEDWSYILKAHPWLNDPRDSYLGNWERGGGALYEHSHGLNLWQHVVRETGHGEVVLVEAHAHYKQGHDIRALLSLHTEDGFIGHVLQDVQSLPSIKWASYGQSFNGCDFKAELEHVMVADPKTSPIGIAKGLRTAEVIAAAHRSAKEERRVEIKC